MGPLQGRQTEIIRELRSCEQVSVADLSRRLRTSEVTIRRDLAVLELAGLLRRVRGGAVLRDDSSGVSSRGQIAEAIGQRPGGGGHRPGGGVRRR